MENTAKYLLIGLLAVYALQQSSAHGGSGEDKGSGEDTGSGGNPGPGGVTQGPVTTSKPGPADCSNLPDGYTIPGESSAIFFLCQDHIAIPMFCPLGFYPVYNGQYVLCSKGSTGDCDTSTGTPNPGDTTTASTTPIITTKPIITTVAPTTTTTTIATTTLAPPDLSTVCKIHHGGRIFSIAGNCSAFGVCIFRRPVISVCLGKRRFDPNHGMCTNEKCSN